MLISSAKIIKCMPKVVLVILIVSLLIVVVVGIFYLMGLFQNRNANSMFEIQGMKVEILKQGSGVEVKTSDSVTVHYAGTLPDGTKIESSVDRNAPLTFQLGRGTVIQGWELGVAGMKAGEKRRLTIPPELAYGTFGFLMIPPNATLIFEVEMLKIN